MPPYKIGSAYFFFMATRYILGRVVDLTPFEIILESASWCPDTGRMYDALSTGELQELEPFPTGNCIINRFAINDATDWTHELPTAQK